MPRAVYAFEHAGIAVVPVPIGYSAAPVAGPLEFIASASGLQGEQRRAARDDRPRLVSAKIRPPLSTEPP